jgi:hypothetical protein
MWDGAVFKSRYRRNVWGGSENSSLIGGPCAERRAEVNKNEDGRVKENIQVIRDVEERIRKSEGWTSWKTGQ